MTNRVIIAGSGFGGLDTALRIRQKNKEVEIIVIDKNPYFTYKPALHEVISNKTKPNNIRIGLKKLYKKHGIKFYNEKIIEAKPFEKTISTTSRKLDFDYLVVAIGSISNFYNIDGVKNHSYSLNKIKDALNIRKEIKDLLKKSKSYNEPVKITVCGGGLTGVEVAAEIADMVKKRVHVILGDGSPKIMKGFSNHAVDYAETILKKKGVEILSDHRVKKVEGGKVCYNNGNELYTSLNIWCGGVKANQLTHKLGLRTNEKGAIMINDYLQSGHPHVYALGDCAYMYKNPEPSTAQTASYQAIIVSHNILASINKKDKKAFESKHWSYAVSFGKGKAVLIRKKGIWKGLIPSIIKKFIEIHYVFTRKHWYFPFNKWELE